MLCFCRQAAPEALGLVKLGFFKRRCIYYRQFGSCSWSCAGQADGTGHQDSLGRTRAGRSSGPVSRLSHLCQVQGCLLPSRSWSHREHVAAAMPA